MARLKIEGMSCAHCVRAVYNALEQVAGVERVVDVDLTSATAEVEGTPASADLVAAVQEQGYEAHAL